MLAIGPAGLVLGLGGLITGAGQLPDALAPVLGALVVLLPVVSITAGILFWIVLILAVAALARYLFGKPGGRG